VLGFIHICLFLFSSLDGELDGQVERKEGWDIGMMDGDWWFLYYICLFFCNLSFCFKGGVLIFFSQKKTILSFVSLPVLFFSSLFFSSLLKGI